MMRIYARKFAAGTAVLVMALQMAGCATETAQQETTPQPGAAASGGAPSAFPSTTEGGTMDHAIGTSGVEALKGLKGKEFDVAYLSQMIAHHEAAVTMAKQALGAASKPETKQEAEKVVGAQTKEIAQMTSWLKDWYGVAPSSEQQALVKADMKDMMAMPITSDRMFFEMMIPHHQGAIDMSELAPVRSERAEVKELAQQIIRDQKAEIAKYHEQMGHGGGAEAGHDGHASH